MADLFPSRVYLAARLTELDRDRQVVLEALQLQQAIEQADQMLQDRDQALTERDRTIQALQEELRHTHALVAAGDPAMLGQVIALDQRIRERDQAAAAAEAATEDFIAQSPHLGGALDLGE